MKPIFFSPSHASSTHLNVWVNVGGTENQATDAAEAVDAELDASFSLRNRYIWRRVRMEGEE